MSEGFEENVEFYRLDYLDVDEVSLGRQFQAIFPLLWMTTGGGSARSAPGRIRTYAPASGGRCSIP